MRISYFQVLELHSSYYPEDLGNKKFSSYDKCLEAVKDIKNRYPAATVFGSESFPFNTYIQRHDLEIE